MTTLRVWAAAFAAVGLTMAAAGSGSAQPPVGNAANGKAIFQRTCANCHSAEIGVNKIGPSLWDVVGRPIASVPDYNYSARLQRLKVEWQVWDSSALDVYLRDPRAFHGVKMYFKGLPDATDRADVIAYLSSLK